MMPGPPLGVFKSGVVYYPFGLTFNSYQRENSVEQRWKFQGQEHIDDLDLGWVSFKWRNHMPDIGRFFNVDPLAESFYYNSPYAFSENKVTNHIELEGLEAYPAQQALNREIKKVENVWNGFVNKVEKLVDKITPDRQEGPTDIEKKNETPIPVPDEEQRDQVGPTDTPTGELDGNLNPLYNPNGTAEGHEDGDKVITQEGSHMKVKNPDKPGSATYDTTWTGRGEHVFDSKADTIKGEAIVNGDTMMVVKRIKEHKQK